METAQTYDKMMHLLSNHLPLAPIPTNNPTFRFKLSDHSSNISTTQLSNQSMTNHSSIINFYTALDSQQSHALGQRVTLKFGGPITLDNLSELEKAHAAILSPFLTLEYAQTDCSQPIRQLSAADKKGASLLDTQELTK